MKTTEEKNRMIAEFMGYKKDPHFTLPDGSDYNSNMLYDYSWDWLMPVGAKCLEKSLSLRQYPFIDIKIKEAIQSFEIEATYQAVVEFIEWYNNHLIS